MPQLVQLQYRIMQRMKIEVSGNDIRIGIIRRVLHRAEIIHLVFIGNNDHSARVLPSGTLNAGTALDQSVFLSICYRLTPFLQKMLHISESGLVLYGTDGACLKYMVTPEQFFGVPMCTRLILVGKIQVNVRLFVSIKAEKCLKRNLVPVLIHFFPTDRTVFMWQIKAGAITAIGNKLTILALTAKVMGRQWVYLRNTSHSSNKGGTDRTSGSDLIAVLIRTVNQLLGYHVQYCEAMLGNRIQFTLQALFNNLRQRVSVHFLGASGGNSNKVLL